MAALRSRGFEAVTPDDVGLLGHEDITQLEWCAQQGFVLVSHNIGDFYCPHREFLQGGKSHWGIVLIRQQTLTIGEKFRRLVAISHSFTAEQMKNRAEFLSHWG